MNLDSQHLISTKCKLLKQMPKPSAFSLSNYAQCKDFTRKTSINDIHSNTLNQIDYFGPYAIATTTS